MRISTDLIFRQAVDAIRLQQTDISQTQAQLVSGKRVLSAADAQAVHDEVMADIDAAIKFAEESPYPDADAILEDVYA